MITEAQVALVQLLELPDPPELPRRAHRLRYAGRPDRAALVNTFANAYLQQLLTNRLEEGSAAEGPGVPARARDGQENASAPPSFRPRATTSPLARGEEGTP